MKQSILVEMHGEERESSVRMRDSQSPGFPSWFPHNIHYPLTDRSTTSTTEAGDQAFSRLGSEKLLQTIMESILF